jgi:hypothetical protein
MSSVVEPVVTQIVELVEPNAPRIWFEVTATTAGLKPAIPRLWLHTRSVVAASPGAASSRSSHRPLGGVRNRARENTSSTPAPPRAPLPTGGAGVEEVSVTAGHQQHAGNCRVGRHRSGEHGEKGSQFGAQ